MVVTWVCAVMAGLMAGQWQHTVGAAPILAALLCASCFLRGRDVALIGLIGLLVRDLLVGVSWFTLVRLAALLAVIGVLARLRVRLSVKSLVLGLGISAPVYHLTLAAGDWITHTCSTEPWTVSGLVRTLASSWPYVQRSLIGDLLFTSLFLGLYLLVGYVAALRWPALARSPLHRIHEGL